jgi:hypothetical protein
VYFVSVGRWQRQREDRTPYGTVARAYGATVGFDDGSGDREANSNAIRLCRNKRREQPAQQIRWQSRAGVVHSDHDIGAAAIRC